MSGIAAFAGNQPAKMLLLAQTDWMRREGAQTAGIAVTCDEVIPRDISLFRVKRSMNGPEDLHAQMPETFMNGSTGIAQVSSFAPDLDPDKRMAPIFQDRLGDLVLAFDGTIDRAQELCALLTRVGSMPRLNDEGSILAELIAQNIRLYGDRQDVSDSLARALNDVQGSFALAMIHYRTPFTVLLSSRGRYLACGRYQGDFVASSDEGWMQRGSVVQVGEVGTGEVWSMSRSGYHALLPSVPEVRQAASL